MTEAEKNEIVGLVMTQISSQAVDFDIATEQPQANDLLTAVRENESGGYKGVTIKWDDVARIATELANQAAKRAEQAETNANNILEQVQSKGTEITNFVATSKAELETQKDESVNAVKSVYQTDLNELKGDINHLYDTAFINLINSELCIDGKYRLYADGYLRDLDGWSVTDYIRVIGGEKMYFLPRNSSHVCFFDSNKKYISGTVLYNSSYTADGSLIVPQNANYITISFETSIKDKVCLMYGDEYEYRIPTNDYGGYSLKHFISSDVIPRNIATLGAWNDNQYVPYSSGQPVDLDGWSWKRIKVNPNEYYYVNKESHVCFYSATDFNSYVSGVLHHRIGSNDSYIKVPSDCYYMIVSVATSNKDKLLIINKKWSDSFNSKKIFEVGDNREYSTILEALEYIRNNNINNAEVVINEGIYNFIDEIKKVNGNDYISNYSASDTFKGYFLGSGIVIRGRGNVKIVCDYTRTGSSDNFSEYVSVFHVYDNTFKLENITVEAKGCRYIIHDDSHDKWPNQTQIGEVSHCHFVDNGVDRGAIIGGGLFSNDVRWIHDCDFIVSDGVNHNVGASYHTNSDSDVCTVRIINCYCEGCTFGIIASGSPTGLSTMYVSNSKVSVAPYETGTGNIKMISWNNEIVN